ncbi:unnamed protein product [Pneumocystis jirovecii]|uniref:RING-type domain-containing protein n=1 Tax=Pneumocystis jirovecii TaxID=42068 RepID=L0PH39_PNEJI|nr:unnamed protein product [Pneumocystis jirovecii]
MCSCLLCILRHSEAKTYLIHKFYHQLFLSKSFLLYFQIFSYLFCYLSAFDIFETCQTAPISTKPVPPPTLRLRELPTCVVCLERMDASVTGLLTILCQHTFHCQCLSKWGGNICPVCRYSQQKDVLNATRTNSHCFTCETQKN